MNLICDTNIWYNIVNNNINPKKLIEKGYSLIANPINVIELIANDKYDSNLKIQVINSILNYSSDFIMKVPDEYLVYIWNTKKEIEPIDWRFVLVEYRNLLNGQESKLNTQFIQKIKNETYNTFSNDVTEVIERFLPGFKEKREKGKSIHKKKKEVEMLKKEEMVYMIFEVFMTTYLKANMFILNGKEMNLDACMNSYKKIHEKYEEYLKEYNNDIYTFLQYMFPNDSTIKDIYEELKVYCNSYAYYILEILSQKANEPNDLGDLQLLIYVNKNNKLFTKDNKWKKIITQSGLQEYLFNED